MRTTLILAAVLLAGSANIATAQCTSQQISGTYLVQVQGFDWCYESENQVCHPEVTPAGSHNWATLCTFRISRNRLEVANLDIICPARRLPDVGPFPLIKEPRKPFSSDCLVGCPHHQLRATNNTCGWELVDLKRRDAVVYVVDFSSDRRLFFGLGSSDSDLSSGGRDSGYTVIFTGVRQ
jgi:hypothetical protein